MGAIDRRAASRHTPKSPIDITCRPTGRSNWFKRRPRPVAGAVVEVSATGMLMDLPLDMKADPGDIVALSLGPGHDAAARVVHVVRDENWTHQWVGIEITEMSAEFAVSLNLLITSLGLDHDQIVDSWLEQSAP